MHLKRNFDKLWEILKPIIGDDLESMKQKLEAKAIDDATTILASVANKLTLLKAEQLRSKATKQ